MEITFFEFVKQYADRPHELGRLARRIVEMPTFPRDESEKHALVAYAHSVGVTEEELAALIVLHHRWRRNSRYIHSPGYAV